MKRPTTRLVVLLAVVVALVASAFTGCSKERITIGFLGQMNTFFGQSADKALRDYIKELNAAGGIGGVEVRLVTYDSQGEPAQAANLVKRFVEKDNALAIIGPEWSGGAIPMIAVTNDLKVPVIATTATNSSVTVDAETGELHPWMFRICFIDEYQGFMLADYAYSEMGLRKAAILRDVGDPYATGLSEYFTDRFTELGGTIVANEGYRAEDVEFRAQLTTIDARNPDCLFIPDSSYEIPCLIGKQLSDLGIEVQLLGGDSWALDTTLEIAGAELEGTIVSGLAAIDDPRFEAYNAEFTKKHSEEITVHPYMALDAFMLIEHCLRNGATTRQEVRDAIEVATDVKVFSADRVSIDPKTHNPERPIVLLVAEDSKWKLIGSYMPK